VRWDEHSGCTHLEEDGQQNDEDGDHDQDGDEVEGNPVGLLATEADVPA